MSSFRGRLIDGASRYSIEFRGVWFIRSAIDLVMLGRYRLSLPKQSATGPQQGETEPHNETVEVAEKIWLPPRDSNPDMLIQSPFVGSENKANPPSPSADSGKVLQNPQPPRNQDQSLPPSYNSINEDDQ
jgi:hypothetical protein